MSDVSSFIESTWQQISLDDTWSHYQEHQEKNYTSRKITREGSFSIWANSRVKDETYFPPQKIFVVITKLERLEKEKKKKK